MIQLVEIVTYKNRFYAPNDLRIRILKWCHHYPCHPGKVRMHKRLASIVYWEKMEDVIRQFIKQCPTYPRFKKANKNKKTKKENKKYGKIPPKIVELNHWDTVCVLT